MDVTGAPRFSLIVATLGRLAPLDRLLASLAAQQFRDFEVIVVDQNRELDLGPTLSRWCGPLALRHIRAPQLRGVSAARNLGWRAALGRALIFPDDDCWYPRDYLRRVDWMLAVTSAAVLTGRAADSAGRTINGRFGERFADIRRGNVFTSQIEWNMAVSARLMRRLGGYDEGISLGGDTPWQGGEGYDLVLRAIAAGGRCVYHPDLVGHHDELPVAFPDAAMAAKGRAYGRGLGFVLRKHGFGVAAIGWWLMRSAANLVISAATLRPLRVRYFAFQLLGRAEGWLGMTLGASDIRPVGMERASLCNREISSRSGACHPVP